MGASPLLYPHSFRSSRWYVYLLCTMFWAYLDFELTYLPIESKCLVACYSKSFHFTKLLILYLLASSQLCLSTRFSDFPVLTEYLSSFFTRCMNGVDTWYSNWYRIRWQNGFNNQAVCTAQLLWRCPCLWVASSWAVGSELDELDDRDGSRVLIGGYCTPVPCYVPYPLLCLLLDHASQPLAAPSF